MQDKTSRADFRRTDRRTILKASLLASIFGTALGSTWDALARDDETLSLGPASPFSFDRLTDRAKSLAKAAYVAPPEPSPEVTAQINYDVHGKLRYKPELALGAEQSGAYPATFFHLGMYFRKAVRMHVLDGGSAREIRYSPGLFEMPSDSVARQMAEDSGFAGFRLQEVNTRKDWRTQDWVAFLGASYFRAIGDEGQYGLSARGLAINTSSPGHSEEFPDFIEYFIEPAKAPGGATTVYGLLNGPSVTGAYRFQCERGKGVVMDVDCRLFLRKDVAQLGIAPMTSMFWYAEYDKPFRADWRPEVHDSDGLAMWTGRDERILRPLNAPSRVVTSSFSDESPRGFGLVQRDRCYNRYLDGVRYDRRPSLWVEPLSDFGRGKVQLVEIPTEDEYHDNIVAFWSPDAPVRAGDTLAYSYRLHWQAEPPFPAEGLARVAATRQGHIVEESDEAEVTTRFVVEFEGGLLDRLAKDALPSARVEASMGELRKATTSWRRGTRRARLQFDLQAPRGATVELKATLQRDGEAVSEVWAHQYNLGP